ncbi:TerC family protein [Flavobacteriales bacterium]|jgi:predicted tellurium resistance membrane protein TerC|nr:TerC family protein [Flavobacteriales bacterium]
MIEGILTLLMLVVLQAVLGFDNLLYISLEAKRVPEEKQKKVRTIGIAIAMVLRIGLLFVLVSLVKLFEEELFAIRLGDGDIMTSSFSGRSLIEIGGGVFIIYTAIKEIWHMMKIETHEASTKKDVSVNKVIASIVIMNVVFSFDSILAAMSFTENMYIMTSAIVISGGLMIWLSGTVSSFLKKNRLYEVLGLFILLVVGIMILTEGGHRAHLYFFGEPIEAMSKTTFYFVLAILVLIDIVQGKYQKKLLAQAENN